MAKKMVSGFGVKVSGSEKKFEKKSWGFRQQKLLSFICSKFPEAKADLGIGKDERLSWEYGGWSKDMIEAAHNVLDKYVPKLPPRDNIRRF